MHLKRYYIRPERCNGCQRCSAVCPAAAIQFAAGETPVIDSARCIRCGACKKFCRRQAIAHCVRLQF